jgi:hypothetical protein
MAEQRTVGDVYEDYAMGYITLSEASREMRRIRGHKPSFWRGPAAWFGWWIQRVLFCSVGSHVWIYDSFIHIPFYGTGHLQCFVCRLTKVKP